MPPFALGSAPRTSKSVKILCDYWNQQLPQGTEGRFKILLEEALTRTSLLPATTPQLLLNWSIGHLPPLALGSALRTSKSVKNLCDYWNQQLPQGAEGRF